MKKVIFGEDDFDGRGLEDRFVVLANVDDDCAAGGGREWRFHWK